MNRKFFLTAILCVLVGFKFAYGQVRSEATDKGAMLVSGTFSFSSKGGDLYEGFDDDRLTTIAIVPSLFYFISPGLGVGGDLSFNRLYQRDFSAHVLGIGPKVRSPVRGGGGENIQMSIRL